jgi:hypothetical protein
LPAHASPGTPFKSYRERIEESRQGATIEIAFKDPSKTPCKDAIKPRADRLNGLEGSLRAAECLLVTRPTEKRYIMEAGKSFSVAIGNQRDADRLWIGIGR